MQGLIKIWNALVDYILFKLDYNQSYDRLLESKLCPNCEYLKLIIEKEKLEKMDLVDKLIAIPEVTHEEIKEHKPIMPNFTPWRVQKAMLEKEDRERFSRMHGEGNDKDVEGLEVELGIKNADK